MEKEQNNKVADKENNAQCVAKIYTKWNNRSFSYSTTGCSTYLELARIPSNKPSQIASSGLSNHPSISPSVAMSVNTSPLPSIIPTILPSDVPSEKPMMLFL